MWVSGFQATGLDQIIGRTGVTKGALYHHFENKHELGYAVLEEIIRPMMIDRWMSGLEGSDDPPTALRDLMDSAMAEHSDHLMEMGCPLNNLTQEMAQVDEGFRTRIEALLLDWRKAVAGALERGMAAGTVRSDIDPEATATFLIATWEGMAGMAKGTRDKELMMRVGGVLVDFLESLRPAEVGARV